MRCLMDAILSPIYFFSILECRKDKAFLTYETIIESGTTTREGTLEVDAVHIFPTTIARVWQYFKEATEACNGVQDAQASFDNNVRFNRQLVPIVLFLVVFTCYFLFHILSEEVLLNLTTITNTCVITSPH